MDRNELIAKIASNEDDELFLRKVSDKMEKARQKNIPVWTRFMTAAQQIIAERFVSFSGGEYYLSGGWENAERKVMGFLPDWMEAPEEDDIPVSVIKGEFAAEYANISHRDVLGALMGLGIERDTVGDINVSEGKFYFAATEEIVPYIMQNFTSVGRAAVSVAVIAAEDADIKEMPSKIISATVSTLRLDSIVSAGFKLSREKSVQLIKSGKVTLNHEECLKPDKQVGEKAAITVRGSGKISLDEIGGETKKGRISVKIKRFL